jgi:hypothetical protein
VETPALMQRRAIVVLLAAVAALSAALVLREREEQQALQPEERLFPDFDPASLTHLELHQLAGGTEVVLECDAERRWFMTEPIPYPAELALVSAISEVLAGARGLAVEGADPAALGLDPPRIVLVWRGGGKSGRLEVGAEDVDGARVFVRAGDRILRASRAVVRPLELGPHDYRDRGITGLLAREVVSLRRRGALVLAPGEPETDLTLDALLDPVRGWMSVAPRPVALDPVLQGFLVRAAAEVRAAGFESDAGDLARFGLEPPRLRVELEDERGGRVVLRFGCREPGPVGVQDAERWYAAREGAPHVWSVASDTVGLLSAPAAELYDTLLLRAPRAEIAEIELARLALARTGEGEAWLLRTPEGEFPADAGAVSDVLAALEFARFESFDPALALGEAQGRLAVTLRDGRRLGGELGAEVAPGRVALRRFGDELVGVASGSLRALSDTAPEDVRSRRVHAIETLDVAALELSGPEGKARFERNPDTGGWSDAASGAEAPLAFDSVRERLLYLDAKAWLPAAPAELADTVRVSIVRSDARAGALELVLGRDAEGRAVCLPPGGAAVEVERALHEDLRALLH